MGIETSDIKTIRDMLSEERLNSLIDLTGSPEEAIELHQETLRLGTLLMGVIATIEISLRNSVCQNLTAHLGVTNWLMQPPIPFQWRKPELQKVSAAQDSARRAEYAKLTQAKKHALDALAYPIGRPASTSHLDRAKHRRRHIQVSEGKIVAELTFYFWKRLYGPEYEQSLWRPSLKRTFPFKKLTRAQVAVQLEHIYQSRNRLAHHEPVLHRRYDDTMKAIRFVIEHLEIAPPSTTSPLAKLLASDLATVDMRAEALHRRLSSHRASA